jgi:uncharacterized protein (DUF2384 family)
MPTSILVKKAIYPKNTWCSKKKEKQFTSSEVCPLQVSLWKVIDALHHWLCQNEQEMILRIGISKVGVMRRHCLTTLLQK